MLSPHDMVDLFLHVNKHLNTFAGDHPLGVYGLLVAIVFTETGLVVWPFLPGDSLLFAVGALAASAGSPISLPLVIVLMCLAANCGDLVNYSIGRAVGPRIFFTAGSQWATASVPSVGGALGYSTPAAPRPPIWQRLLSKKHLLEAQAFYDKHGRKTIIIARFVPIIRTFAPFVAGIGKMAFSRFIGFSIAGGVFWVTLVTLAGYLFGTIPWVDKHFEIVVLAIVAISLIPMAVHALQSRGKAAAPGIEPNVPQSSIGE
jgi:membrane-associated protein